MAWSGRDADGNPRAGYLWNTQTLQVSARPDQMS
jgi:hypothetical protein